VVELTHVSQTAEWAASTPADEQMDTTLLTDLVNRITRREFGAINSLLIVRNERLVVEEYFNGWTSSAPHTMQSVSKSVTSLAAGLAVDRGQLRLTDRATTYFPDYEPLRAFDGNKQALTVRDLLMMRTGLDWSEQTYAGSPLQRLNDCACDWLRFVLDWPMREPPSARWEYVSGGVILLGGIIGRVTGQRVDRWLDEQLFALIGAQGARWIGGLPDGLPHTGGGLYLRPRDMAKVGTLVVNDGQWQGRQVISAAWMRESTQPMFQAGYTFAGRSTMYGYLWWGLPGDIVTASGARGQWIFVDRQRRLVVATTAENNGAQEAAAVQFLYSHVLPATH
jgi:CubicO group peptidase (beta-lactamase class C family)